MKVLADIDSTSNDAKTEYSFSNGNSEVWSQDKLYTFVLNDGTVVSLENTAGITSGALSLIVDLNGFKTPNIGAKDLCRYVVSNNAIVGEQCGAMATFEETQTPEVDPDAPLNCYCMEPSQDAQYCTLCSDPRCVLENGFCWDPSQAQGQ